MDVPMKMKKLLRNSDAFQRSRSLILCEHDKLKVVLITAITTLSLSLTELRRLLCDYLLNN